MLEISAAGAGRETDAALAALVVELVNAHAEVDRLRAAAERVGRCGNTPPRFSFREGELAAMPSCTLRAGHAGFHEDAMRPGTSWGRLHTDPEGDDPVAAVAAWMEREAAELAAEVGRADERGAAISGAIVPVIRSWASRLRAASAARTATPPAGVAGMLAQFHDAFGQPFGHGSVDASDLRVSLHKEEHRELLDAYNDRDLTAIAHELADVVYVAYGSAHSLGIPLDAVIAEVHRANMSKFGEDGRPVLREDGKVMKGPNYQRPDVAGVLAEVSADDVLSDDLPDSPEADRGA